MSNTSNVKIHFLGEFTTKARIPLPWNSARNMMGVLDETGTLEYGQIFVQYSESAKNGIRGSHTILEGVYLNINMILTCHLPPYYTTFFAIF